MVKSFLDWLLFSTNNLADNKRIAVTYFYKRFNRDPSGNSFLLSSFPTPFAGFLKERTTNSLRNAVARTSNGNINNTTFQTILAGRYSQLALPFIKNSKLFVSFDTNTFYDPRFSLRALEETFYLSAFNFTDLTKILQNKRAKASLGLRQIKHREPCLVPFAYYYSYRALVCSRTRFSGPSRHLIMFNPFNYTRLVQYRRPAPRLGFAIQALTSKIFKPLRGLRKLSKLICQVKAFKFKEFFPRQYHFLLLEKPLRTVRKYTLIEPSINPLFNSYAKTPSFTRPYVELMRNKPTFNTPVYNGIGFGSFFKRLNSSLYNIYVNQRSKNIFKLLITSFGRFERPGNPHKRLLRWKKNPLTLRTLAKPNIYPKSKNEKLSSIYEKVLKKYNSLIKQYKYKQIPITKQLKLITPRLTKLTLSINKPFIKKIVTIVKYFTHRKFLIYTGRRYYKYIIKKIIAKKKEKLFIKKHTIKKKRRSRVKNPFKQWVLLEQERKKKLGLLKTKHKVTVKENTTKPIYNYLGKKGELEKKKKEQRENLKAEQKKLKRLLDTTSTIQELTNKELIYKLLKKRFVPHKPKLITKPLKKKLKQKKDLLIIAKKFNKISSKLSAFITKFMNREVRVTLKTLKVETKRKRYNQHKPFAPLRERIAIATNLYNMFAGRVKPKHVVKLNNFVYFRKLLDKPQFVTSFIDIRKALETKNKLPTKRI
jgi:hypothetical protein